jgi:hypothetical protein
MSEKVYEREWMTKLKCGEYLSKWKDYDSNIINGFYCDIIDVGEDKYTHCTGFFSGIGDVTWWIKDELDKLSEKELEELEWICRYKTYISKEAVTRELVQRISDFYGCNTQHIYRTGDKEIINICNVLTRYHNLIKKHSHNDRNEEWLEYIEKDNPFKILSFDEYKHYIRHAEAIENGEKIPSIVVTGFGVYLDGGTVEIKTEDKTYYIDHRLKGFTDGKIYTEFPDGFNQDKMLQWDEEEKLLPDLIEGLESYEPNEMYKGRYKSVIEDLKERLE